MAETRQDNYEYYTSAVHATYAAGFLAAYVGSTVDDERIEYALFGNNSTGNKGVLSQTVFSVWHTLALFQLVVGMIHKRTFPKDNDDIVVAWSRMDALLDVVNDLMNKES